MSQKNYITPPRTAIITGKNPKHVQLINKLNDTGKSGPSGQATPTKTDCSPYRMESTKFQDRHMQVDFTSERCKTTSEIVTPFYRTETSVAQQLNVVPSEQNLNDVEKMKILLQSLDQKNIQTIQEMLMRPSALIDPAQLKIEKDQKKEIIKILNKQIHKNWLEVQKELKIVMIIRDSE